jgi:hypothetical protein
MAMAMANGQWPMACNGNNGNGNGNGNGLVGDWGWMGPYLRSSLFGGSWAAFALCFLAYGLLLWVMTSMS